MEQTEHHGPPTTLAFIAWKKRLFEIDTELSGLKRKRDVLGQMIESGTTLLAASEHLKQISDSDGTRSAETEGLRSLRTA